MLPYDGGLEPLNKKLNKWRTDIYDDKESEQA